MATSPISERRLLFLLSAVQFVNVLDFMMVMPLGPDFAEGLGIPASHLGWVGGSYTASAALAGMLGASVLDRFDRRRVLALALGGLALGTFVGGLAVDLTTLLLARVLAGAFGGPATSIGLAIIADSVPPERRGRALGTVFGAFSVAAIFGVPVGLELARLGSWRTPFFAVAALCVVVTTLVISLLPPFRAHLEARRTTVGRPFARFIADRAVLTALGATAIAMSGGFAIIPNLSAFFQYNLGYPRERLGLLYFVGGIVSFAAMRLGGRAVDRFGAPRIAAVGSVLMAFDLVAGFLIATPLLPPLAVFVVFMLSNSLRAVSSSSLSSRVPLPSERARFMSTQAAVQHLGSSAGAMLSSSLLSERPGGALVGMNRVATFSLVLAALLPFVIAFLSRQVRAGEAIAVSAPAT